MKAIAKVSLVAAGYAGAAIIAAIAVAVQVAVTSGPDRQASAGMHAFGDLLLFIAVFGIVSLLPTGAALIMLRPYRRFWTVLSALGICIATTGLIAAILFAVGRHAPSASPVGVAAGISVLRILIAPVFAAGALACTIIAPHRGPRIALLAATAMEALTTGCGLIVWCIPLLEH